MKHELQVTQPKTSEILKRLGIRLRSEHYWKITAKRYQLIPHQKSNPMDGNIAAFTIADLGNMIPWGFFQKVIVHKMPGGFWQVELSDKKMHSFPIEVEARAFYLIDLIQSGQVKVDEINHPEKYNAIMPHGEMYPVNKS